MALTLGFTRSICAMKARVSSVADTLRARIICASLRAGVKHSSVSAVMGVASGVQASATGNGATFRARFTSLASNVTKRFALALLARCSASAKSIPCSSMRIAR